MNRWRIPDWLEREVRQRDTACVYCRTPLFETLPADRSRKSVATWEHIINDARIVTRENIARCCAPCNSSKGTKALSVWLASSYCSRRGIGPDTVADVVKHALTGASDAVSMTAKHSFDIKDAAGMLEKARYDTARFNQKGNTALTSTYAAIDYVQTAWHLADWLAVRTGKSKTAVRREITALCGLFDPLLNNLANGQKHFRLTRSPDVVVKTSAPPARVRMSPLGLSMRYAEGPLVIDDQDNKVYAQILIRNTLDALERYMQSLGLI